MANTLTVCLVGFIISEIKCTMGINNRARSTVPPLNMPVEDIPMFLTITFDDALHGPAHEKTELIMDHTNRNGEQIPLVYFISNEFSDYSLIQQRYLQGCEMAVHTVTHSTNVATDIIKWYHEIKSSRELISTHADIPMSEIVGFRAPYLEKSDLSFQVLNSLEPLFLYDSTVISPLRDNDLFDWPYTFDVYESSYSYQVGQGPKQSYPGFWEIPMYELYEDISNRLAKGSMDYTGDYTLLDIFKANFLHRMNTNKSPMGLYFHSSWLYTSSHVDAMNDFIDWVLSLDNTWIVNNKDIIDWINNPITNAQYSYTNNNQLLNGLTTFTSCSYAGIFKTVQTECPPIIPHDLQYDDTQLISSNIIITSSSDNILTTVTDLCVNDNAPEFIPGTTYCASAPNKDFVHYNSALYECQWWTNTGTPGDTSNVWLLIKECALYTESFVKGIISPYGTVSVLQDNVLNINIDINPGFDIPHISVTVDSDTNTVYDLSIFEDYELHTTVTSVTLIIRFAEIVHAQYTITFSFTDQSLPPTLTTLNPSQNPTLNPTNPTVNPSITPTRNPTQNPTQNPSQNPTVNPSNSPSISPVMPPSISPTLAPINSPSISPTNMPSNKPTTNPSNVPTLSPTHTPSSPPTTISPSISPTQGPSQNPTVSPSIQSNPPTISPTNPTINPTKLPSVPPTYDSIDPTQNPSQSPTLNPSQNPTTSPTSKNPTQNPSQNPTLNPTNPTVNPSVTPTTNPSQNPSVTPTTNPSKRPTTNPAVSPTLNDLCMYDKYTYYDSNTIYCANTVHGLEDNDNEFVRFMDSLYQCQQRTRSLTPVSVGEDVWLFIKDCFENPSTSIVEDVASAKEDGGEISMIISKNVVTNLMIGGLFVMLGTIAVCIVLCWVICKQKNKHETTMAEIASPKSTTTDTTVASTVASTVSIGNSTPIVMPMRLPGNSSPINIPMMLTPVMSPSGMNMELYSE